MMLIGSLSGDSRGCSTTMHVYRPASWTVKLNTDKVELFPFMRCPSLFQINVRLPVLLCLHVNLVNSPLSTTFFVAVMLVGLLGGSEITTVQTFYFECTIVSVISRIN